MPSSFLIWPAWSQINNVTWSASRLGSKARAQPQTWCCAKWGHCWELTVTKIFKLSQASIMPKTCNKCCIFFVAIATVASNRWIQSTFSSHCPLSSKQCRWFSLTIFPLNFLGEGRVWKQVCYPTHWQCCPPPSMLYLHSGSKDAVTEPWS